MGPSCFSFGNLCLRLSTSYCSTSPSPFPVAPLGGLHCLGLHNSYALSPDPHKKLLNYFFIACKAPEWLRQWPGQLEREREWEREREREEIANLSTRGEELLPAAATATAAMTVSVNKVKSIANGPTKFCATQRPRIYPLTPSHPFTPLCTGASRLKQST